MNRDIEIDTNYVYCPIIQLFDCEFNSANNIKWYVV